MEKLIFFFLLIASVLLSVTGNSILFYSIFLINLMYYLFLYFKTKKNKYLIFLVILSIISPDNYLIIGANMLFFLFNINGFRIKKNNVTFIFILFFCYLLINILLNDIKIINLFFSILYSFQIFTGLLILNNEYKNTREKKEVEHFVKKMLIIEIVSVFSFIFFNFNTFISRPDGDIIVGTFGQYQGNVFAIFLLFAILVIIKQKMKFNSIYIVLSLIIFIMTGSIMLILCAFLSILIYVFVFQKKFSKKSIKYIAIITFCFVCFIQITPTWVFNSVNKMLNEDNITRAIGKIKGMEIVFNEIPSKNFKNYILGEGIGQYSSRSAMTCTGEYIDVYNKFFSVSMSQYTKEYIYPQLVLTKQKYQSISLKDTYYSSVISVMGELGIIGIIFFVLFLCYLMRKSSGYAKLFVIFFVFLCFIDNYLEYAKIVSLAYLIINLYNEGEMKYED